MAVATVRFESEALGGRWLTYQVILPETGSGPFPVLIQLHGLGDDSRGWIERTNLVRYAEPYPLIIAMPDGETSSYLNWKEAGRIHRQAFETMVVDDLPNHLRRFFNVTDGPWAIGGLSMGGYGAMRLGLKYPDRFASIWAHSSAFHIDQYLEPDLIESAAIADANIASKVEDLVSSGKPRPVISFDCGVDDELIEYNRELHEQMTVFGLEHHYAEYPGGHTWDYWDEHVRDALAQHAEALCYT